jgi:hypothetical protein
MFAGLLMRGVPCTRRQKIIKAHAASSPVGTKKRPEKISLLHTFRK